MKKLVVVIVIMTNWGWAQNSNSYCETLAKLQKLILKEHVQPKPIDDSLSVFVFDNIINSLDPARNIFWKTEYKQLEKRYRLTLDDQFKSNACNFITDLETLYYKGLARNKSVIEKIKGDSLNFSLIDTVRYHKKPVPFYLTSNNLEKAWKKKIRYDILNEVAATSKNLDSLQTHRSSLITSLKQKTIENEICKINTLLQKKSPIAEKVFAYYCNYFDPHTNYLTFKNKSNFLSALSKERLSLGFTVALNEKNEILIEDIETNGPAYRNGKLKKGDQIIAIANANEFLQVNCAAIEQLGEMIVSDTNKIITLTIKRKGVKNFTVTLEKEISTDKENSVLSFIVEDKKKIGYLKIPSFYSNFDQNEGSSCAEDVASEIIKLQNDNIQGLIIDLMDNGGGSMDEAIKLAGFFIPKGPISIVVDHSKEPQIIQNPHSGYSYKGPVVLLVNSNSASASEFFAAILQDYNRAMVIGCKTIGKATMQTILPIDDTQEDFVKITINKFYRITGKSHQAIGVIPDVVMPVLYENLAKREDEYPTAFHNDHLKESIAFTPFVQQKTIQTLADKSKSRIANNPYFTAISYLNKRIDEVVNPNSLVLPLQLNTIHAEQTKIDTLWKEITNFKDETIALNIKNATFNEALLLVYPADKPIRENQMKELRTNHYLKEAMQIIQDYYDLQ